MDDLKTEAVRSRSFLKGALTQLEKVVALAEAPPTDPAEPQLTGEHWAWDGTQYVQTGRAVRLFTSDAEWAVPPSVTLAGTYDLFHATGNRYGAYLWVGSETLTAADQATCAAVRGRWLEPKPVVRSQAAPTDFANIRAVIVAHSAMGTTLGAKHAGAPVGLLGFGVGGHDVMWGLTRSDPYPMALELDRGEVIDNAHPATAHLPLGEFRMAESPVRMNAPKTADLTAGTRPLIVSGDRCLLAVREGPFRAVAPLGNPLDATAEMRRVIEGLISCAAGFE